MRTVCFCVFLMFVQGTVSDPGLSFLVALPQGMENKSSNSFLHVMPTGSTQVTVTVASLPTAPVVVDQTFTVNAGEGFKFTMEDEGQVLPLGNLVSNMTLLVSASAEVMVVVANTAGSNGDLFSPIPVEKLGTEHFIVAGNKQNSITASFIAVSAAYDDTIVTITLPARASAPSEEFIVLRGVTYYSNDIIIVTLNRLQTLQLQMSLDLTGTKVVSSKPVSVLSGQNRTNLSGVGCRSHILEQMPPDGNWGKTFILVHLPNQTSGDYYRFVAKEPMTVVTLGGGGGVPTVLKIQYAGDFAEYDLSDGQFVYASSNKPVLVAQYTREQGWNSGGDYAKGDPSLLVLSALEHARDVYHFVLNKKEDKDLFVVFTVRQQDQLSLKINGQDLSSRNVTWDPVDGASDYVVGYLALEEADLPCTLGQVGGPTFNAHVYYATFCECWAMSLTHGQPQDQGPPSSCPTSSHSEGDGIDNDCDANIDEEPCCTNSEPLDQDGDQYKNEDCASGGETTCCSSTGKTYPCRELMRRSIFKEEPNSRRRAETTTPVKNTNTKISCGVACLRVTGCWGTNFDPEGREGHKCELLSGVGMGLVTAQGWRFQSMKSVSEYSAP